MFNRRLASNTLTPWTCRALAVVLVAALVEIVAESVCQCVTPSFWARMIMMVIVATMTVVYVRTLRRRATAWDSRALRPAGAKVFVERSALMRFLITIFGRFNGQTRSFCA